MGSRCTGHCCAVVDLPVPLSKIKSARPIQDMPGRSMIKVRGTGGFHVATRDVRIFRKSLKPIHTCLEKPRTLEGLAATYHFACSHWTGHDCAIYEDRPDICRDYPEPSGCEYRGCTLENCGVVEVKVIGPAPAACRSAELDEQSISKASEATCGKIVGYREDLNGEEAIYPEAP